MSSKKHKRKPSDQLSEASSESRRSRRIAGHPPSELPWSELEPRAKERVQVYQLSNRKDEQFLKPCLISCLDYMPQEGRESLARDVIAVTNDQALRQVYYRIYTGLLGPMKGRSRVPSLTEGLHGSRRANADIDDEPQTRYEDSRDACLQRGGHRCVVSGAMDAGRWEKLDCPEDVMALDLEAAHIIPYAYGSWKGRSSTPRNAVAIWTILYQYFPDVRRAGMNFKNINDPSNGMMLIPALHVQFGKFLMAFDATDVPHTYKLKIYPRFRSGARKALPKDGLVTFTKAEGSENIPLPNPVLLDCHFRIAEVLNTCEAWSHGPTSRLHWPTLFTLRPRVRRS